MEWADLIETIELRDFPIPIKITYVEAADIYPVNSIVVEILVKDRETGLPIKIGTRTRVPDDLSSLKDPIEYRFWQLRFVRNLIIEVLGHELDEQLLFGGVRAFDPHRKR